MKSMTSKLKIQIAFLTLSTFAVGIAFGLYLASQMIGVWIPELAK